MRVAYVNGRYRPHDEAAVHIEDRGFQFADGVYEVCAVIQGKLLDEGPHLDRLERSLRELRIPMPMGRGPLGVILREVVSRNRIRDGIVYFQVTRGVAPRDHAFPAEVTPSLVVTAKTIDLAKADALAQKGIKVVSVPEIRWQRCDIKTVGLLPNVLAKQAAREQGAYEAWFVDGDGLVREGSSTNAWIVLADGTAVTRQLDNLILHGVTRKGLIAAAAAAGIKIAERSFSLAEAKAASEAFISAATTFALPVVQIDEAKVGTGKPGPIALKLREIYREMALAAAA